MRFRIFRLTGRLFTSLALISLLASLTSTGTAQQKSRSREEAVEPADGANSTPRPESPSKPADPGELKLQPDAEGKVRFNFHGQRWLGVLEWIAEISGLSLDWQEVPSGYLNLRTQQSYSIDEARDLINRHLLDRGFTLLKHGEILSVVKVRKVDPSLVPRVEPEELSSALPHEFARVSFALEWMTAEAAVEDLKPLISPNGKLTAIKSTNRLEAIDAVANLRDIQKMLSDPQSPHGPRRMVREFRLQHVKAAEILPQLNKLMGLEKRPANEQADLMQQLQKLVKGEQRERDGQKPQQGAQVQLVANVRDNSIVANAPADQMAIIAEALQVMDHPSDRTRSVLRNAQRVQVYSLEVADPDATLRMVQELGDLAPDTKLQVDKKNRSIVAHANLADHLTIRTLLDKLDRAARNFRVIPLSQLEADYVAGSIDLVMGGGESGRRQPARDPEEEARRFRVVGDVERNRLLLWVNDDEFDDVKKLLVELGEPESDSKEPAETIRVLESKDPEASDELLRRLEQAWPGVAPNPLELGPGTKGNRTKRPGAGKDPDSPATNSRPAAAAASAPEPVADATVPDVAAPGSAVRLTRFSPGPAATPRGAASEPAEASDVAKRSVPSGADASRAAGVRIDRDAGGRLIVASRDPRAVEMLQKLAGELMPAPQDFQVFRLKHKTTWASFVADNLKQFFDERQKADDRRRSEQASVGRWYDPNGGRWISSPRAEAERKRQSKTPPKFIVDSSSNSILAVGADPEQLRMAAELIEMYDVPEASDKHIVRQTKLIRVRHGNVKQISEAVREIYRDLISSKDNPSENAQLRRLLEPTYTVSYGGPAGRETLVKFRGQLSISYDEGSASVIVSAPERLLEDVEATIKELDEGALDAHPRVEVLRVGRGTTSTDLQRRLMLMLGKQQQR